MAGLAPIDWLIILLCLTGVIVFGTLLGRGQRDTRDYFLGARQISWWAAGLSIVATETSALTFLGIPAMAFGPENLTFAQLLIGYALARVILAFVFVRLFFRGEIYSPYQLLGDRYGNPARMTGAAFFLIAGTLAAGVRVYVTCIPIQLMLGLGEQQMIPVIVLFVVLALIYTYVGGVKAVVWTDVVQFFLFVAGGLAVLFSIPALLHEDLGAIVAEARDAGKLQWFHGQFSWTMPFNIWMGVVGATVQVLASHGVDQLVVQRILACKSERDGRRSLLLSALVIVPLMLLFLFLGTFLYVYYRHFPDKPIEIPEIRPGVGKTDYLFPIFILTAMPSGLKGLLIVAVISAAMSSVSSALSALASVTTMDFCRRLTRHLKSERWYLRFSRLVTVFSGLLLVFVAWWTKHQASVLEAAFSLSGLTSGPLLGAVVFAVWRSRTAAAAVVVGLWTGLAVMLVVKVGMRDAVAWPWYTCIGASATFLAAELVSFLGRCLGWLEHAR